MSVTVYGASDDLIEVEGDIREEFPWMNEGSAYLAFSNGVVLRMTLGAVWRIAPVAGADLVQVAQCPEDDEDNYSDRATVSGDVSWVVCGLAWAGDAMTAVPARGVHEHGCERGDDCVECGGCGCGLNERGCTGPGCYSLDAYDQWRDESGMSWEEGSYG